MPESLKARALDALSLEQLHQGAWHLLVTDFLRTIEPGRHSFDEQLACVRRELALRKAVYAKRVLAGHMTQEKADQQLVHMQAVHDTLMRLKVAHDGQ